MTEPLGMGVEPAQCAHLLDLQRPVVGSYQEIWGEPDRKAELIAFTCAIGGFWSEEYHDGDQDV